MTNNKWSSVRGRTIAIAVALAVVGMQARPAHALPCNCFYSDGGAQGHNECVGLALLACVFSFGQVCLSQLQLDALYCKYKQNCTKEEPFVQNRYGRCTVSLILSTAYIHFAIALRDASRAVSEQIRAGAGPLTFVVNPQSPLEADQVKHLRDYLVHYLFLIFGDLNVAPRTAYYSHPTTCTGREDPDIVFDKQWSLDPLYLRYFESTDGCFDIGAVGSVPENFQEAWRLLTDGVTTAVIAGNEKVLEPFIRRARDVAPDLPNQEGNVCQFPHPADHGHEFPYIDGWDCLKEELIAPFRGTFVPDLR